MVINSLFYKKMHKNIRGVMQGLLTAVTAFGATLFSNLIIALMPTWGLLTPFVVMGVADFTIILICIGYAFAGKFNGEFLTDE